MTDAQNLSQPSNRIFTPNTTQIPNIIFDYWMEVLTPAQFKVLLCVCRKTFGWHKKRDAISLSQISSLTGLSKEGIRKILKELIKLNLINKYEVKSKLGDNEPNIYEINVLDPVEHKNNSKPKEIPKIPKNQGYPTELGGGTQLSCPTKETITKEKKNKRSAESSRSSAAGNKINFSFEKWEFTNISQKDWDAWKKAYSHVDLEFEMAQAIEWLKSNPTKKNKKLWRKFLTSWFAREERKLKENKETKPVREKTVVSDDEKKELTRLFKSYNSWMDQISDPIILNSGRLELAEKTIIHNPSGMHSKKTLSGFKNALKQYCKLTDEQIERIFV
ncbi:MAG: replication protein [Candidatus Scalindua sp.]